MGRLALAIAAVIALAGPAAAGNQEDAVAAMNRGVEALKANDVAGALEEFQRAIALVPEAPVPYRYAGDALERLGRWEEAIASYQSYLEKRPDSRDASEIRARIRRLEAEQLQGEIEVDCRPVGATVAIDDRVVGVTPLAAVRMPRGDHIVLVAATGYLPKRLTARVQAGETWSADCDLDRLPPPTPRPRVDRAPPSAKRRPPPVVRPWYLRRWVWAIAGTVVVAGGGTAAYLAWPRLPETRGGTVEF